MSTAPITVALEIPKQTIAVEVSELSGVALDWAVDKCEARGLGVMPPERAALRIKQGVKPRAYSCDWGCGGPIIWRERIWLAELDGAWSAKCAFDRRVSERREYWAKTPLIAAMRCYVASKLGDFVEVPTGLCSCERP